MEKLRLTFRRQVIDFYEKHLAHMCRTVCDIDYFYDLHAAVQLFLNLLKGLVIADHADRHAGNRLILCRANGQAVDIIVLAGKKPGYLRQYADLILYIKGYPSFAHLIIHFNLV